MTYELCDLGALSHFQVPQFPHLLNDGNKWSYYYYQSNRFALKFKWGFPCGSAGKESACNAGDLGSILGLGRSPGEGKGCPLQHSGLANSMDCIVHGVPKSPARLSNFHTLSRCGGF